MCGCDEYQACSKCHTPIRDGWPENWLALELAQHALQSEPTGRGLPAHPATGGLGQRGRSRCNGETGGQE